jgi:hypothetical protein
MYFFAKVNGISIFKFGKKLSLSFCRDKGIDVKLQNLSIYNFHYINTKAYFLF